MRKAPALPETTVREIRTLRDSGLSHREIAKRVNVSSSSVFRTLAAAPRRLTVPPKRPDGLPPLRREDARGWLRVKGFIVNGIPSGFIAAHRTGITILASPKRTRIVAGSAEQGYLDSTEHQPPSVDLLARMLLQLPPDLRI